MARNVGPPSFRKVTRIQPRSAPYSFDWRNISKEFKADSPSFCAFCGHKGSPDNPLETDHIIPKSKKGKDIKANFRVLCRRCNRRRNKVGRKAHR
jgi:5-methylcytosine-specific restriction endonuclease McrA